MQTVLVTGITGKSGSYFLRKMILNADKLVDYRFVMLVREQSLQNVGSDAYALIEEAKAVKGLNIDVIGGNLTSVKDLEIVFSQHRIDTLLHIAGIKFSLNLVSVALKHDVDNFILVHTTGIYSKYKAAGEIYRTIEDEIHTMIRENRTPERRIMLTILRPTMIYGDLQDGNLSVFIKMVDKLRLFPTVGGARYDLQPIWCKDLGEAYYDVLMNWPVTADKEYILSGGQPIQLREMFETIARQLGVKNVYISCPFVIAYAGAWLLYCLSFKKYDFREKVQRLVEPRAYPHTEAAKDFGFAPAVFEVGIKDEIQMYLKSKR